MRSLRTGLALALLTAACSGDPDAAGDARADGEVPADAPTTDDALADDALADDALADDAQTDDAQTDATQTDATQTDATQTDATQTDATRDAGLDAPAADAARDGGDDAGDGTVAVSHAREFRGAWVATVYNINFPSASRLTAMQQQAEIGAFLDVMQRNRLNAVVFQVRPEGDAVYRSTIEPWSRFLTGRQGGDPGYDPGAVLPYNGMLWMNPAASVVQQRLVRVIRDVVSRYDIDGVHFDDYFYPYPQSGMPFPDSEDYQRYRTGGGALSLGDWRRDNVNQMVRQVSEAVAALRPSVRFGVSPFGIYRPGMPAGITGLDAYNAIYCDPVLWMRQGWVDYLTPQLYWPSTQTAQAYGSLIAWWAGITSGGRSIFAGNNLGQLGSSAAWSVEEFRRQVTLTRAQEPRGARGNIWFTVQPFASNRMGIADVFRRDFYTQPVLTPPMAGRREPPVAPTVTVETRTLRLTHPQARELRAWVVYREAGGGWQLDRIVPAATASVDVTAAGRYAVSAANRFGDEGRGAVATVR